MIAGFCQALSSACRSLASLLSWQANSSPSRLTPFPTPSLNPPAAQTADRYSVRNTDCRTNHRSIRRTARRTNRTDRLRIGTFNVQSLGSLLKQLDTLPQDLHRYKIDILGLQETKLYTLGRYETSDYTLLTLPAKEHHHGIGFAVSPRVIRYLHRYWAHSDRIGVLQMRFPSLGRVNVITAYSPHSGRPLHEVDAFYADLRQVMDTLPRRDITLLTGDFNAKLGHQAPGEAFLGKHARGTRNRNGHILAEF